MMETPVIIVLHGALGSAAQMAPVATALELLGHVVNLELAGHGAKTAASDADVNIPAFVEQLREVVTRESNGSKPFVFGYSMGGYVGLALDAASPGTLAGIVTLGTKFAWSPALALRETARLDPKVIAEKVPKFAAVLTDRHAVAGGWELVLDRTGKILASLGDSPILTQQSLAHVQARVCVAVGDKDDTVSADESSDYAAFIPNATTAVLPETPHPIERVSPDAVVALMRKLMHG